MNWGELGIAAGRWALTNSAGAAVLVILVLIVQKGLGERISPRWRHNLWLLVVVRLMLPALPGIHIHVPQWTHEAVKVNQTAIASEHALATPSSDVAFNGL